MEHENHRYSNGEGEYLSFQKSTVANLPFVNRILRIDEFEDLV